MGVALQHTEPSSAWSVPQCWMGAVGCVPAGQLSAQPVGDGAGSKPQDTDSAWWGVPTKHPPVFFNRKNRQKKPPKPGKNQTTTTKYPNLQNPEQTQVSLPVFWACSKQTITQMTQLVRGPAEAEILLVSTTALSLPYLSRVPYPAPNISLTCPGFSPCLSP